MLLRSARGQRPSSERLTLQQLALLQEQVAQVTVPSPVMEGLELLSDELERALQQQVSRLPDYVPTRYFSQRSVVKGLWALKAAVVRDRISAARTARWRWRRRISTSCAPSSCSAGPARRTPRCCSRAPWIRASAPNSEIIRLEHKAFDESLAKAKQELTRRAGARGGGAEVRGGGTGGGGHVPQLRPARWR